MPNIYTFSWLAMWIFGYGSLLWRPDFPYLRALSGVVNDFARRFWQRSPDHRGIPAKPGLTVTLVANPSEICWGIAFEIAPADQKVVIEYLDDREKAGYERRPVSFQPDDRSEPFYVDAYIAVPVDNPNFTGPCTEEFIVKTILSSSGPSGSNLEYALKLAATVHSKAPHINDEHLFSIERKLLECCSVQSINDSILNEMKCA